MNLRCILIGLLVAVAAHFLYAQVIDLMWWFQALMARPVAVGVEAGPSGIKVFVDNTTTWKMVGQMLVTVLGTYLGIKLINKFVR